MIRSMTGFGSKEREILPLGKICVELRGTNHKFLDIVLHLPEEITPLEDKIKKEIAQQIQRGRITCVINVIKRKIPATFINKSLLKSYVAALKNIKSQFRLKDEIGLDTLIHLPGILSTTAEKTCAKRIWPRLKALIQQALVNLTNMRDKEGRALYGYLKKKTELLKDGIEKINRRFKKVIKEKIININTDEERSAFLKESDITEEVERFTFHVNNFKDKLAKNGSLGKELDFIAQEMQREVNTIGAKSCDTLISAQVVEIKSQIEKIREQAQNIE